MRSFSKGEFVVEYAGDLISIDDAKVTYWLPCSSPEAVPLLSPETEPLLSQGC